MKRVLVGKIIGIIGLIIFTMGISYIITYQLEKSKYENINLLVTFEDTKTFEIENYKLTKEEALNTYPYIFNISNKGLKTTYDLIILDDLTNLKRSDLNYLLYEDDKLVKEGNLSDINNNVLYTTSILKNKTKTYKCYIYLINDLDIKYQYQIKVNYKK